MSVSGDMDIATGPDCASLDVLADFDEYVRQVRRVTQFDDDLLQHCRRTICRAVWGDNNPDISGIGVSIGYAMEAGLGFFLAVCIVMVRQRKGPRWQFCQLVTKAGFDAFFGSAIYFALSLEVASIYMLVHKDYGISTEGLGASEAQLILAVSVICILPLLYPVALLPTSLFHPESEVRKPTESPRGDKSAKPQDVRLTLFCLLTVLFFYPFLSQCIHNGAPSRIGEGNGPGGETIATADEWAKVGAMCFGSVETLSDNELWMLAIIETMSSLIILLFTIWLATGAGVRTMSAQDREFGEERRPTLILLKIQQLERIWQGTALIRFVLLIVPTALAGPLLWCIFRLRNMQSVALERLEIPYTGNEWGFGQVVGIIIFAPVITDMAFAAWAARSMLRSEHVCN